MPGPTTTTPPFGVQDPAGARALAVLGPNTRVRGAQGFAGTAVDALIFPGPLSVLGKWIVPNTRVEIGGVRTVGATSQGIAYALITGLGPPFLSPNGPMVVSTPDTRITNT